MGDHVGDVEHSSIIFNNGEPVTINLSQHSWGTTFDWTSNEIEKEGTHPITYNARGTHATYNEPGLDWYAKHTIFDITGKGERWDLWKNLEIIFPW